MVKIGHKMAFPTMIEQSFLNVTSQNRLPKINWIRIFHLGDGKDQPQAFMEIFGLNIKKKQTEVPKMDLK